MRYTRIYADTAGESHFEDVDIPLPYINPAGKLSANISVTSIQFRENKADYNWDFHNAPNKQFIVLLDGIIEVTTSLGEIRTFKGGEILLVEDTTGKGHKTINVTKSKRQSIFIII
jgi:hypothetical protein